MPNLNSFFLKIFRLRKWPSKSQWGQIFKILSTKETILFIILSVLFAGSAFFLIFSFFSKNTELTPADGGSFIEGEVGYPRFINPIYAEISDVDRDLSQFIFAGLMKYDSSGKIVPDLIKDYKILEGNRTIEISLKDNLLWQDGEKITADDVIFTIETIQNPDYKSPLRATWVGVEVEKTSDLGVRFNLKNPSAVFLENLTLKILPRHIWQNIKPGSFPLSTYNLQPIGSGPYKIRSITQDKSGYIKSLTLEQNTQYFGQKPKIKEIIFNFYDTEENLVKAAKRRSIQAFSPLSPKDFNSFKNTEFKINLFSLPRYFAVFFNADKSEVLANDKVRQALNYGTNKDEIIKMFTGQQAEAIDSPILPELYGFKGPTEPYNFNPEKAKKLLDDAGFIENGNNVREKVIKRDVISKFKSELEMGSKGEEVKELQRCLSVLPAGGPDIYPDGSITGIFDQKTKDAVIKFQEKYSDEILKPTGLTKGTGTIGKATRNKLNQLCDFSPEKTLPLKITLVTVNQSPLTDVANILKKQWADIGADITVETLDIQSLETNAIKTRNYEALLFGEVLSAIPDPLPFWHSLQKKDPGSNLSLYENKNADKLLEDARQSLDSEVRAQKLEQFQDILLADAPAVFLYSQDYIYITSKKIKGIEQGLIIDPSQRFSEIENWYINTKRVWK